MKEMRKGIWKNLEGRKGTEKYNLIISKVRLKRRKKINYTPSRILYICNHLKYYTC